MKVTKKTRVLAELRRLARRLHENKLWESLVKVHRHMKEIIDDDEYGKRKTSSHL